MYWLNRSHSVDLASNGRVIFGIGGGWNAEEMEDHGTVFKSRWKLLRERIEAMKKLWTEDAASYHGEFVNFDAAWSWPKPVQKPNPPILMGSHGLRGMQRVIIAMAGCRTLEPGSICPNRSPNCAT